MSREKKRKIFNVTLLIYLGAYAVMSFCGFSNQEISAYNSLGLLDYQTSGYTVQQAKDAIASLGTEGISLAYKYYLVDYIYLLSGFALQIMITLFFRTVAHKRKAADEKFNLSSVKSFLLLSYILSAVKLMTDIVENIMMCIALKQSHMITDSMYQTMSTCTQVKFISFMLWIPVCILLATILLSKKKKEDQTKKL